MLDHDLIPNNVNNMLKYDQHLVRKPHNSPKNSFGAFQSHEQSWQFVDDDGDDEEDEEEEEEEGEVSYYYNNSMGSSDCISQNLASRAGDPWSDDDSRYQRVLSKIFKNTQRSIMGPHYRNNDSEESAFIRWKNYDGMKWNRSSSRTLLQNALYEVPKMHENHLGRYNDKNGNLDLMREVADNDVNDINHRFSVLSSIVPSRGKVDKLSLLDDTINYLKTLERKVEALQSSKKSHDVQERTSDNYAKKRKASCDLEDLQEECSSDCIIVSAIEKDVTIEIRCKWRENMMVQVFDAMSSLNLESHSVCSFTVDGILTLSIETKLKKCTASTAKMIRQALQRVIGRY